MSVAIELAKRVRAFRYEDLPAEAVHWTKIAILDTFGVTIAGSVHEGAAILRRVIEPTAAAGPCLVMGTDRRLNPLDAAQLNGMAGHMMDFDDSNSQLLGHPSVAILPALLAAAETTGASGKDVIRAYVAAFEAQARLGIGISRYQYTRGYHPTATVGIFGAVAGAGAVLGLDEAQLATAFSIAASMAAGVKSNFGTMVKPLHAGQSGRNAMLAVQLAKAGFTAGDEAFEHRQGYLKVFNGDGNYDIAKIFADWASPLCILDQGVKQKRYPCCYACLAPIDGMESLVGKHKLTPDNVAKIECLVHPIRFPHINVPNPASDLDAKFSIHYCLAQIVFKGTLSIEDFEGTHYRDPKVQAMMKRVEFGQTQDDNIFGGVVRVTTTDGRVVESPVDKALGASYQHPLPPEMFRRKFDDCASRILAKDASARLYETLSSLEKVKDVREVTNAMLEASKASAKKIAA
jgi:2-methylcitrate dehydratase PrpD